ncbi:MAG: hypothetical protein MK165_19245 [Pirellulaceae bacterium]|nr:hypothetical protein [Pirellulaceae bacterium]
MFRKSAITFLFATIVTCLPSTSQATDLSGSWTGSWHDSRTGHHGPLRATFTKLENGDYQVNFRGRFAIIIPFRYSVVLKATEKDDQVQLNGSSDISRRRGTFYYSAEASKTNFVADFHSCKDKGQFVLKRSADSCCRQ